MSEQRWNIRHDDMPFNQLRPATAIAVGMLALASVDELSPEDIRALRLREKEMYLVGHPARGRLKSAVLE